MLGDFTLDLINMREGAVPSHLQLRRDQTVGGIGSVILSEGPVGSVTGSLQIAADGIPDLVTTIGSLRFSFGSARDCARLDDTQQCYLNRIVDAQSPKAMQRGSPLSSRPRQQE